MDSLKKRFNIIGLIILVLGLVFKVLQYPGASLMIYAGAGLILLGFVFQFVLKKTKDDLKNKRNP